MDAALKLKFVDLATSLSGEIISCDGELSSAQVAQKRREIMKEWRTLEAQAGGKVTEEEAWGFFDEEEVKALDKRLQAEHLKRIQEFKKKKPGTYW